MVTVLCVLAASIIAGLVIFAVSGLLGLLVGVVKCFYIAFKEHKSKQDTIF